MKETGSKSRHRHRLLGAVAAPLLAVGLVPASSLRADCLVSYADCVEAASEEDTFWRRSAAGLRCYAEFISCLQRRLA